METAHATTMSIDKETKPTSTASLSTLTHTAKADKLAQAPTKKQPAQVKYYVECREEARCLTKELLRIRHRNL